MSTNVDLLTHQLVLEAQAGDLDAFRDLYNRYFRMVFRTSFLMLGDYGRAEEVSHDVFIRVYNKLGSYKPNLGAFTTWLHRITVNICINEQHRKFPLWFSLDKAQINGLDFPALTPPPLDQVLYNEEQQRIWSAVQHLPIKLRTVIILRYYADLSYEEVAQVIRCPVGTVRSRLNAAHTRLYSELGE